MWSQGLRRGKNSPRLLPCELVFWLGVAYLSGDFSVPFWALGGQEGRLSCWLRELSHKRATSEIWNENFMVKAVNGTVCWWYFVVFCLEKLRPDVYCWRKAMDPLVIMLKTWVLPDISKWMSKICRQLFPQLLSLTSLCCFLICTRWKMMASLIILLWRVDLMTIKSSLIVWWGLYKRDMEIIYTKQEMIWHGRQEVEPHIQ